MEKHMAKLHVASYFCCGFWCLPPDINWYLTKHFSLRTPSLVFTVHLPKILSQLYSLSSVIVSQHPLRSNCLSSGKLFTTCTETWQYNWYIMCKSIPKVPGTPLDRKWFTVALQDVQASLTQPHGFLYPKLINHHHFHITANEGDDHSNLQRLPVMQPSNWLVPNSSTWKSHLNLKIMIIIINKNKYINK